MIDKYQNFKGGRQELIQIISNLEKNNKEKFMMYSKKYKKYLPVNLRRIQQFSDKGLLPTDEVNNKNYIYNYNHLLMYAAIMKLKNDGYTLIQIGKIIKGYDNQKLLELVEDKNVNSKNLIDHKNINQKNLLSERLIKLGRNEGRVLRSQWIRFAITKWCNCEVMKKELNMLNSEDVDTLTDAFKESLLDTIKIENIDKKIS